MDDDGRPVRKCFRTVDLVSIQPVWRFPEQGAFTRADVLRTSNDHLVQDCAQSDDIVVPEQDGPFVKYKDEWEE